MKPEIRFDQPGLNWMTEGLPIGNGTLGAMILGGEPVDRIQFNESSVWPGARQMQDFTVARESLPQIRAMLKSEGLWKERSGATHGRLHSGLVSGREIAH